jgi:hypothetical protein
MHAENQLVQIKAKVGLRIRMRSISDWSISGRRVHKSAQSQERMWSDVNKIRMWSDINKIRMWSDIHKIIPQKQRD